MKHNNHDKHCRFLAGNKLRKVAHGRKPMQELMQYADSLGWEINHTHGGHIRFTRKGSPPVFTSSSPGDYRSVKNVRAMLRRLSRQI